VFGMAACARVLQASPGHLATLDAVRKVGLYYERVGPVPDGTPAIVDPVTGVRKQHRYVLVERPFERVFNAGWHLSYFMPAQEIQRKLRRSGVGVVSGGSCVCAYVCVGRGEVPRSAPHRGGGGWGVGGGGWGVGGGGWGWGCWQREQGPVVLLMPVVPPCV
jgi:hypothetical protein